MRSNGMSATISRREETARAVQLAVVQMEGAWRLFMGAERLGRFVRHEDALACALDIARESRADGCPVEVLDQSAFGEVTSVADVSLH